MSKPRRYIKISFGFQHGVTAHAGPSELIIRSAAGVAAIQEGPR